MQEPATASLRHKLSTAASAAFAVAAIMTALVVLTVWSSANTAEMASVAHERVRLLGQLQVAANDYESASYRAVRERTADADKFQGEKSTEFQRIIELVSQMPADNRQQRETRASMARQARVVLDLFRDAGPLVAKVDEAWRSEGSLGAMREVDRLTAPVKALEETVETEIHRGEAELGLAVERNRFLNRLAIVATILCLAIALGFIVVIQRLLRSRLRPGLAQLARGAVEFGEGNLEHRIGLEGRDELTSLSDAFDAMAATIADKQRALHETQAGLEQAVAERTRELRDANAQLSEVDQRRRAFLANVGHELRTPLTIIRGEAEVALRLSHDRTSGTQDSFECILDQTRSLSRMVDDLFLIARAEAGELPLDKSEFDVAELAAKMAADFDTLATLGGGSIRADVTHGLYILADRDRLQRALTALVENALTHCHEGVNIVIRAHGDGDLAALMVEDDGPGIDPAIAPTMFDRYRRGDTRRDGTGLGLSLVKALAMVHSGKVRLEHIAPHGTRAIIQLPRIDQGRIAA